MRNWSPKGQNLENEAGPGPAKFFIWDKGKTNRFWQLVGGTSRAPRRRQKEMKAQKAKMKGKKAQKAKMKGNEA